MLDEDTLYRMKYMAVDSKCPLLVRPVQKRSEISSGACYHGHDVPGMDYSAVGVTVKYGFSLWAYSSEYCDVPRYGIKGILTGDCEHLSPLSVLPAGYGPAASDGARICTEVFIFTITQPGREKNPCPVNWENWCSFWEYWFSDVCWKRL